MADSEGHRVRDRLGEIRTMLEHIRLEVAAIERKLDELWMRSCPQCMNPLTKPEPDQPWKCERCGWEE